MAIFNPMSFFRSLWSFITEVAEGWRNLRFRRTEPKYRPLPAYIKRHHIDGPEGLLELLECRPLKPDPNAKPVLFQHGGFGHASLWLEWMGYLRENYGGPTYALSVRGHGASYMPSSWFRMVWLTKHDDIAKDLLAGIAAVKEREGTDPILVGHSAGGEMVQYVLAKDWAKTPALGLIGHVPHFGIALMFSNWGKLDPLLYVRGWLFLHHPKGTLATTRLMHQSFFGPDFPLEKTKEFEKWSADYEAMGWPLGSLGRKKNGVPTFLSTQDIIRNIDTHSKGDRVFVLVGTEDKLMAGTSDRAVAEYRTALTLVDTSSGVRFVEIERAGHHVQNDVQWEEAAAALLEWLNQI